ncbi:ankyrin repeat domain-containing protein 9 [Salminus brasiliensis]|uniref:ankyrin repeat domain-containing protein 9 n=1 Tax=Salminus brasiliensis TaxID=930266 RepID=UPI003B8368F4
MPLDVAWRAREDYRSESQCQRSSFAFYCAVRDLLPVWLLEEMRATEALHWEEDGRARAFSPAEALLYALVHDHQAYARHLLRQYPARALDAPSPSFRCCPCKDSAAPHLAVAVRHERAAILGMILEAAATDFGEDERRAFLDGRGCAHSGGKSALHVACEQARAECLLALLANGASPYVTDDRGDTPLDCLLEQMERAGDTDDGDARARRACLGYLLLFTPGLRFRWGRQLREDAARWTRLLGERAYRWLAGRAPLSLLVLCTRTLLSARAELLESLPRFLRPPEFRLQQWGVVE